MGYLCRCQARHRSEGQRYLRRCGQARVAAQGQDFQAVVPGRRLLVRQRVRQLRLTAFAFSSP